MITVHLVARVEWLVVPLTDYAVAAWLWERLRATFPLAWAAVLMREHLHVDTPAESREEARRGLIRVVGGLQRSNNPGSQNRWARVPLPDVVPNRKHHRRVVRYLALNPSRDGLVDDPLCWPWSTHRDVVGAIADPWVDASRLANELRQSPQGFAQRQHAYVSGDPTVAVNGTAFPVSAEPTDLAIHPLSALIEATASATRADPEAIRQRGPVRALFLQLARRHGWRDVQQLATICDSSPRTVRRVCGGPLVSAMPAAELCLGDLRLRAGLSPLQWPESGHSTADTMGIAPRMAGKRPLKVG